MSNKTISKTCSVCGLQKPLSAFLQLAGPEGASYGNVCATCRKKHLQEEKRLREVGEGSTTQGSGKQVDAKARLAEGFDKLDEKKHKEEIYQLEQEKEDEEKEKTLEKEETASFEKKQREETQKKRAETREKKIDKSALAEEAELQQTQSSEQQGKQLQAAKEEQQKGEINTEAPFIDTQIAGKQKYSGRFREFVNWIGRTTGLGLAAAAAERQQTVSKMAQTEQAKNTAQVAQTLQNASSQQKTTTPQQQINQNTPHEQAPAQTAVHAPAGVGMFQQPNQGQQSQNTPGVETKPNLTQAQQRTPQTTTQQATPANPTTLAGQQEAAKVSMTQAGFVFAERRAAAQAAQQAAAQKNTAQEKQEKKKETPEQYIDRNWTNKRSR